MTPDAFARALMAYCAATCGSVTSWGRTERHNREAGGVPNSRHCIWIAADVVYDDPVSDSDDIILAERQNAAASLWLDIIHKGDHDHVQAQR